MKREVLAFLALVILCAGAVWNVIYVRQLTGQLCATIELSKKAAEEEHWAKAEDDLRQALGRWLCQNVYAGISLRHPEIDSVTDDFYDLLSHVHDRSDECAGGYEHLLYALQRLADMETPSLSSIF